MDTKAQIRRRLLATREDLERLQVKKMSQAVLENALGLKVVKRSKTVALYSSVHNEVLAESLFGPLKEMGKVIVFPKVLRDRLEWREVKDLSERERGKWGILEPIVGKTRPLAEVDLMFVPGVAFDERGYRIGFGRGFYDRSLEHYQGWKIGLAYDFQLLEEIPRDEKDLRCDWVVTNKRILSISNVRRSLWKRSH